MNIRHDWDPARISLTGSLSADLIDARTRFILVRKGLEGRQRILKDGRDAWEAALIIHKSISRDREKFSKE